LAPPVCCCAVFLRVLFAQRTAGARSAPSLPCALLDLRVKRRSKARANCAARRRRRVCVHTFAVIARLDRAIQYSSSGRFRTETPRRTGFPAFAGNDIGGRRHCPLLRHCERSEEIQKCIDANSLDCFVARASRNDDVEAVSLSRARLPASPSRWCRHRAVGIARPVGLGRL
jgi:hypothetical protein